MIEKYYAAHIKTRLDAAATNIMRTGKNKQGRATQNTGFTTSSRTGNGSVKRVTVTSQLGKCG
jgi:hypothetical protein